MKRHELEHVLRAAGAITGASELVVLGSQAILGSVPDAPGELLVSQEVDTYPRAAPDKADLIDGTIGELSPFHETFGYYAHGVGPETAVLPPDWEARLVRVASAQTHGVVGLCLHPIDLAVSKLVAAREKDIAFVRALLAHDLVSRESVAEAIRQLPSGPQHTALQSLAAAAGP